jgi:hypothetical protein
MAQNINLHRASGRRRGGVSRTGAILFALLAVAGCATWYGIEAARQAELRSTLLERQRAAERIERSLASAPNATRQALEQLNATEAEITALEAVATRLSSGLLGRTTGFTQPLRALARERTDGVWLTGVRLDNAGPSLVLDGKAMEAARVPALIERLRRAPQFAGTAFAAIEMKPAEEAGQRAPASLVRFRLATAPAEAAATKAAP